MTTLLRDVIDIPERTGSDDYVLRLVEGVASDHRAQTIAEYVVTDDLATAFDHALGLISAALKDGQSRAAFLAGSFGSGKSHFMAVFHALLGHDATARAIPELAPVLAAHDAALKDRKILRLAYHFLEAKSIEETLLGGYVAQIRALHPDCDLPAVHRGDAVIADGENQRTLMGDDPFFAALNDGAAPASNDPWGAVLDTAWTASTYEQARAAAPGSDARQRLVSALVRTFFRAYTSTAEFVSLDEGLAAITRHAKGLGYDAITLFLDELVLWLAFNVRNHELFSRESQKLTKLVEAQGERALPVVSFVARQLDLAKYFAEAGGAGSEQEAIERAFNHQDGRFLRITLGDDNLPYVAEKRLLRPRSDSARLEIDQAFRGLDKRPEVWDALLDNVNTDERRRGSDEAEFRRTYPFSPALVSTLRTLASALQRDRTALKVMQQLLVDQRDTLTLESVVPVGDVFDLVVNGSQPVSSDMQGRFASARTLYANKLRPTLLRDHGLDEDAAAELRPGHPFRSDDRLVKTLVLAAVAPDVPALRDLTVSRLASLNHGSIVSPVPGGEGGVVLNKLKKWAVGIPEISISDDSRNPVVRLRVANVDYESVLERVKGEDNDGRRRQLLKAMVWEALGVTDVQEDAFGVTRQLRIWRSSRREVELVFGNIRDTTWLQDTAFQAGVGSWRFIIDYPFDTEGHGSGDDFARLEGLRDRLGAQQTVAWTPRFLTRDRLQELGRLVQIDYLLGSPERWTANANALAEADRVEARVLIGGLRTSLQEKLNRAIQEAYGAATPTPGTLEPDDQHDVLHSLHPAFVPALPVGHTLGVAFTNLVDQAFTALYPGHPQFEPDDREVRPTELNTVLTLAEEARAVADNRAPVTDKSRRDTGRRVANPLGVGHMGETHFVFNTERFSWDGVIDREMSKAGLAPDADVTVAQLREWIDAREPAQGLTTLVSDLIICAWALVHDRAWFRYEAAVVPRPTPGGLTPEMVVRAEPLPSPTDWSKAVARVGALFGLTPSKYLTGAAVADLAASVRKAVDELKPGVTAVKPLVDTATSRYLDTSSSTARQKTLTGVAALLDAVQAAGRDAVRVIEAVANAELSATDQAAGTVLKGSAVLAQFLKGFDLDRVEPLTRTYAGPAQQGAASAALARLRSALQHDEFSEPLAPALNRAEQDAWDLVKKPSAPEPAEPPHPAAPPRTVDEPGRGALNELTLSTEGDLERLATLLREALRRGDDVNVRWWPRS